jgi:hypothetical protein
MPGIPLRSMHGKERVTPTPALRLRQGGKLHAGHSTLFHAWNTPTTALSSTHHQHKRGDLIPNAANTRNAERRDATHTRTPPAFLCFAENTQSRADFEP